MQQFELENWTKEEMLIEELKEKQKNWNKEKHIQEVQQMIDKSNALLKAQIDQADSIIKAFLKRGNTK